MRFVCLIICLGVVLVSLGGCSGGGGGGGGGDTVSYSLVGTWRLTNPSGGSFEMVGLVFNSDSTATANYGSGASVNGTWSLTGNALTLTLPGTGSAYFTINWVDANNFNTYVGNVETSWQRV